MKVFPTLVQDCKLIELTPHEDNRGLFIELFQESRYSGEEPICHVWRQINYSLSTKDVVRGLHYSPYSKLVSCIKGKIFDVVVDLRKNSKTYMKYFTAVLDNSIQMYVPPNCAHGFMALEEENIVIYAQNGNYLPKARLEKDISWRDPELSIQWPHSDNYILSDKDKNAPNLNEALY